MKDRFEFKTSILVRKSGKYKGGWIVRLPGLGWADVVVMAKDADEAKAKLLEYIDNELAGHTLM